MQHEFHIQDPGAETTQYLFEAIIFELESATEWRAMYAFASRQGVESLLQDPVVQSFGERGGRADILVGLDAVTNRDALEALREYSRHRPDFRIRVFWNPGGGLFHPKVSYFLQGRGRQAIIVGSGNLTPGGLRENYEAYSVLRCGRGEYIDIGSWDRFIRLNEANFGEIDERALTRAERNIVRGGGGRRRGFREVPEEEGGEIVDEGRDAEVLAEAQRVLLCLVPRAGGRWHQVHFNRDVVREFFRISPNTSQRVYLSEVDQEGQVGNQEVRPCVYSEHNKNHKIELGARRLAEYPREGVPIVLFRELQLRTFTYMLLMPGDRGYAVMLRLSERLPVMGRGHRRVLATVADIRAAWPDAPLLNSLPE